MKVLFILLAIVCLSSQDVVDMKKRYDEQIAAIPKNPTTRPFTTCNDGVDLVFAMDASESMGGNRFSDIMSSIVDFVHYNLSGADGEKVRVL